MHKYDRVRPQVGEFLRKLENRTKFGYLNLSKLTYLSRLRNGY